MIDQLDTCLRVDLCPPLLSPFKPSARILFSNMGSFRNEVPSFSQSVQCVLMIWIRDRLSALLDMTSVCTRSYSWVFFQISASHAPGRPGPLFFSRCLAEVPLLAFPCSVFDGPDQMRSLLFVFSDPFCNTPSHSE